MINLDIFFPHKFLLQKENSTRIIERKKNRKEGVQTAIQHEWNECHVDSFFSNAV